MKERLKKIAGYYRMSQATRAKWFNWKWRLFVILLGVLLALYVNDYLQGKYPQVLDLPSGAALLADKLFSWFMTGVIFGILLVGLMYEGEFIIGLNKLTRMLENAAAVEVDKIFGTRKKTAAKKKR